VRFHRAEGASFMAAARPSSWDVVVVDAYDADDLATGIGSRAFFATLGRVLRPGGAFAFNVIGSLELRSKTRTVIDAASSVFDDLRVVPVMTADERFDPAAARNVVLVGRKP
jgi:spermidine synthase